MENRRNNSSNVNFRERDLLNGFNKSVELNNGNGSNYIKRYMQPYVLVAVLFIGLINVVGACSSLMKAVKAKPREFGPQGEYPSRGGSNNSYNNNRVNNNRRY
jgi:hypothetical protein